MSFQRECGGFFAWANSQDSRLPAEFEISRQCRAGVENVVAVQVMRWSDGSYLEDQDHWWLSGIHRNVLLLSKPKVCPTVLIKPSSVEFFRVARSVLWTFLISLSKKEFPVTKAYCMCDCCWFAGYDRRLFRQNRCWSWLSVSISEGWRSSISTSYSHFQKWSSEWRPGYCVCGILQICALLTAFQEEVSLAICPTKQRTYGFKVLSCLEAARSSGKFQGVLSYMVPLLFAGRGGCGGTKRSCSRRKTFPIYRRGSLIWIVSIAAQSSSRLWFASRGSCIEAPRVR